MIIIGIAGGTGSGKTTVVRKIMERLPEGEVGVISQDSYYKDSSHVPPEERQNINFDEPAAFDWNLLLEHVKMLKRGESIEMPTYSYLTCSRQKETVPMGPHDVVLIEGIMALVDARLRKMMDIKVFVDADGDDRLIRVISRDCIERGRTAEAVIDRYQRVLKPMHQLHIEPTKKFANIIIPEGGNNEVAINLITDYIKGRLTTNKNFNPTDFTRVSGLKKIGKQYYYFTPQTGVQVKGFIRLTNTAKGTTSTYYFNPKKKGARAKGLTKISKRYYYFKNNGKMKTGVFKIKGKYYCFDPEKGYRVNGLQTVNGKTYYFTKKLGYSCMTGWKKRKGIKYYFSSSAATYGQAVTGWLTLGGKQYYFNDKGEMQTGWQTINNKKYYFDPTSGAMATGEVTIGGTKYTFGKDGTFTDPIANATGPWSIRVNLSTNIVTCYRGSTAVKAMYCSPGAGGATPTGTTTIQDKLRWHELMGPSWGQYCEHLFPSILFHSVPYQRAYDPSSMSINGYNQLGQAVSHGCIRLACIDAYYIYTNCPVGTTVKIDYFGNTDPLKATHWPSVRPASGSGLGYDPTDPVYS